MKVLHLNCRDGKLTMELAKMVGPEGQVVGVDISQINIEISKQKALSHKINNTQYFMSNQVKEYQHQTYDLVFARFLLSNSKNPFQQLKEIYQMLTTEGRILLEDLDFTQHYCFPSNYIFYRYIELFTRVAFKRRVGFKHQF